MMMMMMMMVIMMMNTDVCPPVTLATKPLLSLLLLDSSTLPAYEPESRRDRRGVRKETDAKASEDARRRGGLYNSCTHRLYTAVRIGMY